MFIENIVKHICVFCLSSGNYTSFARVFQRCLAATDSVYRRASTHIARNHTNWLGTKATKNTRFHWCIVCLFSSILLQLILLTWKSTFCCQTTHQMQQHIEHKHIKYWLNFENRKTFSMLRACSALQVHFTTKRNNTTRDTIKIHAKNYQEREKSECEWERNSFHITYNQRNQCRDWVLDASPWAMLQSRHASWNETISNIIYIKHMNRPFCINFHLAGLWVDGAIEQLVMQTDLLLASGISKHIDNNAIAIAQTSKTKKR